MASEQALREALEFCADEFRDKAHVAECRGETALARYYAECSESVCLALAQHPTSAPDVAALRELAAEIESESADWDSDAQEWCCRAAQGWAKRIAALIAQQETAHAKA